MKKKSLALGLAAGVSAAVLALTGCAAGTPGGGETTTPVAGPAVTVNWGEPENPLIPANTNEVNGGLVLNNLFAGLIYYEADGSWAYDAAESIESDDFQHWTIKLKPGQTFSDGSALTAESFVKAWQWAAADPENLNQWWFIDAVPFEGGTYDGGEDTLALEVVDDTTFTVALTRPMADFPLALGYTVFFPLPESFYEDTEAFGEAPIGNGPYKLSDEGWVPGTKLSVVPNETYTGPRTPQNSGVDFVVYSSEDAQYADLLADNLDIIQAVPQSALATFQDELGDRAIYQGTAVFQSFTIQPSLAHFAYDEEGTLRRAAISHAINRQEITDVIFEGTRTPAEDFTSPVIAGFDPASIEGSEVLDYDPELAKELWAQADAISPWSGTFQIAYNADSSHQPWVDATANSIKNVLGIDASGLPFPDFAGLRTEVNDRTITAAFRTGWQFDFPSQSNILGALYVTGAGSNDSDYSNPEFDALFQQGVTSATLDEQVAAFNQAQALLFRDLPAIPLWYGAVTAGHSTLVNDVEFGWDSWPILYKVTKTA
ncbi:MAG: ABC transporter substrate-binding protein [Microbacteriaceae bacterium]|nr:ABC transporter substrate-binding protein [Microbacteriaceae bacterium]